MVLAEGVSAECLQKRLIFLPFIEAVPFDIQAGIQTERRTGDLVRGGGPGEALGAGALILPPCPLACQCCSGATVLPSRAGGSKAGPGTELSPPSIGSSACRLPGLASMFRVAFFPLSHCYQAIPADLSLIYL